MDLKQIEPSHRLIIEYVVIGGVAGLWGALLSYSMTTYAPINYYDINTFVISGFFAALIAGLAFASFLGGSKARALAGVALISSLGTFLHVMFFLTTIGGYGSGHGGNDFLSVTLLAMFAFAYECVRNPISLVIWVLGFVGIQLIVLRLRAAAR